MGKIIRRVVAVLLTVTAILIAVLPASSAEATTTHGDYEYDGNTLVKYLGSDSEVTLPNWITKIGKEAFFHNTSLAKVVIPDSVREIDFSAFEGCTNLQIVVIPESVRTIGSSAFSGCKSLYSISLPAKLSSLGSGVFAGCNNLATVPIDPDNLYYATVDGVIYTKDGSLLVQYLAGRPYTTYGMSSDVSSIGEYSFWGASDLADVSISPWINTIPEYAFANCDGLKKVILPNSVERINAFAFADCSNLEYINIPDSVGYIDEKAFYNTFGTKIRLVDDNGNIVREFNAEDMNNTNLSSNDTSSGNHVAAITQQSINGSVEDYNSAEEVTDSSSNNQSSLYNGSFSGSDGWVTEIANKDYSNNSAPGEIGSTKILGGSAVVMFSTDTPVKSGYDLSDAEYEDDYAISTGQYKDFDGEHQISGSTYAKYLGSDSNVTIPADITDIGSRAFYKNEIIENVSLPNGIEYIGDFAFARSTVSSVNIPEGVEKIGYGSFYNCDNLDYIAIPSSVSYIALGAFNNSRWFDDWKNDEYSDDFLIVGDGVLLGYKGIGPVVDIPTNVKHIAAGAFSENPNIKSVNIPGTVIDIGEEAFCNCKALTSVKLNEGLVLIHDRAFRNTTLTAVSIPDSVVGIGLGAFEMPKDNSFECVIFKGKDVPYVTHDETATRLSAGNLRKRAFENVNNAIIESDCNLNSGDIFDPSKYGFVGQLYSIDSNASNTLILEQATTLPDENGIVNIKPRLSISNTMYIMDNVKEHAFDYYKTWNEWSKVKPTGININGNSSYELSSLLENVTSAINDDYSDILSPGITVMLEGSCFNSGSTGHGSIPDNDDSYVLKVTQNPSLKDELSHAYFEATGSYPNLDTVYLDMELFDSTQTIQIHKLGSNKAQITIPVPSSIVGNNAKIACLDDNGVFNELSCDIINDGADRQLVFVTSHFSPYMIYSRIDTISNADTFTDYEAENLDISISEIEMANAGLSGLVVKTLHRPVVKGIEVKWFVVVILVCTAGILITYKPKKRNKL